MGSDFTFISGTDSSFTLGIPEPWSEAMLALLGGNNEARRFEDGDRFALSRSYCSAEKET